MKINPTTNIKSKRKRDSMAKEVLNESSNEQEQVNSSDIEPDGKIGPAENDVEGVKETSSRVGSCREEIGQIIGAEGEILGSIDIEVEDTVMDVPVPNNSVVDLSKLYSSDFFESFIEERISYYFQEDTEAVDLRVKRSDTISERKSPEFSSVLKYDTKQVSAER